MAMLWARYYTDSRGCCTGLWLKIGTLTAGVNAQGFRHQIHFWFTGAPGLSQANLAIETWQGLSCDEKITLRVYCLNNVLVMSREPIIWYLIFCSSVGPELQSFKKWWGQNILYACKCLSLFWNWKKNTHKHMGKLYVDKEGKSQIWKYFVFEADDHSVIISALKPICKRCYLSFQMKGGNTSNLAEHLKDRHLKVSEFQFIRHINN